MLKSYQRAFVLYFSLITTLSEQRRCIDDAFVKICQMVNDFSMKVRVEAAGLLGSLHLVGPQYLQQTLDKKVMSHLKARTKM